MARRSTRSNPWNQPKPAEWDTMSKKLRKAWNRTHWRPHEYMVEVPLKRYATRKANQKDGGAGRGMLKLAAKIERMREKTNPYHGGHRLLDRAQADDEALRTAEQANARVSRAFADAVRTAAGRISDAQRCLLAELKRTDALCEVARERVHGPRRNPRKPRTAEGRADRAERKRVRSELAKIEREETVRPYRENPKRRTRRR